MSKLFLKRVHVVKRTPQGATCTPLDDEAALHPDEVQEECQLIADMYKIQVLYLGTKGHAEYLPHV